MTKAMFRLDKRVAHAARDHGVLHETLRNWPGALRSDHPDAGVVAIGPLGEWITKDHPFQYGYGTASPLEKVVQPVDGCRCSARLWIRLLCCVTCQSS